jgi:hypothetical protein
MSINAGASAEWRLCPLAACRRCARERERPPRRSRPAPRRASTEALSNRGPPTKRRRPWACPGCATTSRCCLWLMCLATTLAGTAADAAAGSAARVIATPASAAATRYLFIVAPVRVLFVSVIGLDRLRSRRLAADAARASFSSSAVDKAHINSSNPFVPKSNRALGRPNTRVRKRPTAVNPATARRD